MTEHLETHILSKFQIIKKIGSGAYGHVWKVIDNKDKKVKALKKNFDAFNNSTDAQRTFRQIMFLMQLKHPNIVILQQVIRAQNNNDIYLVFQHMDIDLYTLIRQGILQQKHKKWILYQIGKAMYYLHSAGLIHRDLKPSNILVNQSCQAKLCDFGLIRSLDQQTENDNILTEYIATRWYRAPEIIVGSAYYTKAIDIWGFGCLVGEIFKGKPLFPGTSTINQMERILAWTGYPKESQIRSLKANGTQIIKTFTNIKLLNKKQFIPNISQQALDLMAKCMHFDPQKRITIEQILKHPFLKQFYNKNDLKIQTKKIKISIDDNERLNLKDYRNLIYKQIKSKDTKTQRRESINKTLYRIRQASTKKHLVSEQTQSRAQNLNSMHKKLSTNLQTQLNQYPNSMNVQKSSVPKKKSYSLNEKGTTVPKHLKTTEKEWNPIETQKAINFRESVRKTFLVKPKHSISEVQAKKSKRMFPSSNQIIGKGSSKVN